MGFINATEALIAGTAAAAAVLALYFLKLKRREHVVSSTLLWQRTINDLTANSPFQKLRSSILLFLQLLLLAMAAFALARPMMNLAGSKGGDIILLVDVSSSMNTKEAGGTRLDLAKNAAKGIIHRMPKLDSMMILTFAGQCTVRKSFTSSKSDLERAVDQIAPGEGATNLEEALSVAIGMGRSRGLVGKDKQRIVILSDGGFEDPADLKVDGHITATGIRIFRGKEPGSPTDSFEIPLQFVSVGKSTRNAAITHLDTRTTAEDSAEIFVSVENFSDDSIEADLSLYDRGPDGKGDQLVNAVSISLEPKGKALAKTSRVFQIPQVADTLLEFTLDVSDDLPADNHAWIPLRKPRPPSVLLVTNGNIFLKKALAPDSDQAQFAEISPDDYPSGISFDVTVFDNWAPAVLEPGSYIFIGKPPPIKGVEPIGYVEHPVVLDWDHSHPLARFLDFSRVELRRALHCKLPKHARQIVEGDRCPLIFAVSELDTRVVCVAFDVIDDEGRLNTTWPFYVSFPVFFSNAVSWLNPELYGSAGATIPVGSPITFNLPGDVGTATITNPSGREFKIEADKQRRVAFGKTHLPGPYRIRIEGKDDVWIAANVLSRKESDIAVRKSFDWSGSEISGTDAARETPREIWKYFALFAVAFLMTEWYVYHRHGR